MARTFRRSVLIVCTTGLLLPGVARAQDPAANDPEAGSPSGVIYEIPLDTARADAAPRAEGRNAVRPNDESSSPIRSENGFGSSSAVPGVRQPENGGSHADRQRNGVGQRGDATAGRAAANDGAEPLAEGLMRSGGQATAQPSGTRAFLLIALAVVVAVGLGVASRRPWPGT